MNNFKDISLKQIDFLLNRYEEYRRENQAHENANGVENEFYTYFRSAVSGAVKKIAGPDSAYMEEFRFASTRYSNFSQLRAWKGILQSLRDAVENEFLMDVSQIIHGELFSDFLDMAYFLLNEGYKDASAVIVGGVIETHLRQLCIKNKIELEMVIGSNIKPKRADQLNADLTKKNVYNVLDQKSITAWLDLRNKAAHARYAEYTREQVDLMLQGVRNFIARYPA